MGVAGLERLWVLVPLLRHANAIEAYGLDTGGGWLLSLPGARLTLMVSSSVSRACSGEDGILSTAETGGGVGWNLTDAAPFTRHLPFGTLVRPADQPRRRDAEALLAAVAAVRSGRTTYVVRRTAEGERCTCAWYAKHGLTRGPCNQILAGRLAT